MAQPNLLHPVPVDVQQVNRSATVVDPDFREEMENVAYGAVVTLPGQIKWYSDEELRRMNYGSEHGSAGYILFRVLDLKNKGIASIREGDKFVAYGTGAGRYEVNVFVTKIEPQGHYQDRGGPTLLKAYFADRNPASSSGAGLSFP